MQEPFKKPYADRDPVLFPLIERTIRALCAYHDHQVFGIENIPAQGPGMVVCNHSLATYDTMLLAPHIADQLGRELFALVDRFAFRTPGLRTIFEQISTMADPDNAEAELRRGKLLLIMPGGMREALRDSQRKYQIDWRNRRGFVRLSMKTGAPIILAACPRSDDIYRVYRNPVTSYFYARFKLPVPVFRGVGPTWVPKPVKLWHLCSEPMYPDVAPDQVTERDIEAYHQRLVGRMEKLMNEALALQP